MKKDHFLVLTISTLLSSCICNCTEIACDDPGVFIRLVVQDTGDPSFDPSELDSVFTLIADSAFEVRDTMALVFNSSFSGEQQAFIRENDLERSLTQTAFIIVNPDAGQRDTIRGITFEREQVRQVCNSCTGLVGCEDEYASIEKATNKSLIYNGSRLNTFEIFYEKKE